MKTAKKIPKLLILVISFILFQKEALAQYNNYRGYGGWGMGPANPRTRRKNLIRFLYARRRLPLTTYALAGDYLVLCRNPLADLNRWVLESGKKHKGRSPFRPTTWRSSHAQSPSPRLASRSYGFRGHPLHAMSGRLGPGRREWSQGHRLSSRPGAGAYHYDRLRSLRNEVGGSALISRIRRRRTRRGSAIFKPC